MVETQPMETAVFFLYPNNKYIPQSPSPGEVLKPDTTNICSHTNLNIL